MSQHETNTTDTEEDTKLEDPDNYHETQRLREIHEARQNVAKQVRDMDINQRTGNKVYLYSMTRLCNVTALYVSEILPLVRKVEFDVPDLPDYCTHDTLRGYATNMGMDDSGNPVSPSESLTVYRHCNEFLAEIKPLVSEEQTDEWEI